MIGKSFKTNRKNLIVQFIVGGVIGGVGAHLVMTQGEHLDLGDAHLAGLLIAALLLILGVAILAATLTRSGAVEMIGGELEPGEDMGPELRSIRFQGIAGALAGLELAILSMSTDVLRGPGTSLLLLAILAMLMAVQTWLNFKLWQSGDELFRQVINEAMVGGFLAFQFLLFFWVIGARFGMVANPDVLDIYVLMMVVYLIGSAAASVRRGYASPA